MEEYFKLSQVLVKRLKVDSLSRKEEKYLLFRMLGPVMQARLSQFLDLTLVPCTFLHGNPHLDNYARTGQGVAMLDFDRSRIGPYCWDIIRFLSALSLRREGRHDPNKSFLKSKVVEHFLDAYITHFQHPELPTQQYKGLKQVKPLLWQLSTKAYLASGKRWSKKLRDYACDPQEKFMEDLLKAYLVNRDELGLLEKFEVRKAAVVPGSFGKKHYVYALSPRSSEKNVDDLLLDIKEVYEEEDTPFFKNPSSHHGLRMIEASKIYADGMEERLGYCTLNGQQYWGRQIPCFAVKVKTDLSVSEQCDLAFSVGTELGRGHRLGLPPSQSAALLEQDLQENFDRYVKLSEFLTFELQLFHETLIKEHKLYQDYWGF